jgi:preprotein translocase subunit SecD
MSRRSSENLLYDWRIVLLIFALGLSLWIIQPNFSKGTSNIKLGFDLAGGSRAILTPQGNVDQEIIESAVQILQIRTNTYGLKDVTVRSTSDMFGNRFITVEAAGTGESELRELLETQGKFEAKIGNDTVFGGADIFTEEYSGGVKEVNGGFQFQLPVRIRNFDAQQRFATLTSELLVEGSYLSEPLDLYMDDQIVDSLSIDSGLQGRIVDSASITGGGETREDAQKNMKRMATIIKTGALPVKLEVSSIDSISPRLGQSFIEQVSSASMLILVAIGVLLFVYYRDVKITAMILGMSICAAAIVLGIAASSIPVIGGWQIDIPSIAGLIVALAVGIDQQVIITDQLLRGEIEEEVKKSLGQKLKDAGFIIFASFGTTLAAMLPLMVTHLGALKGFAITSIVGEAVAYFITRPAYLKILPKIIKE